jgi:hypothetical protein
MFSLPSWTDALFRLWSSMPPKTRYDQETQ